MNRLLGGLQTTAAIVAATLCFGATPAQAGLDLPSFFMTWDVSGDGLDASTYNPADFGRVHNNGDGTYSYAGGFTNEAWTLDWSCTVDPDPFIDAAITVTNNSDTFETFFLLMTLSDIDPISPATLVNGSVAATVTNNEFFGGDATLRAPSGGSLYAGYIDLVDLETDTPVATLWDDGYELVAVGGLASESDDTFFSPMAGPAASSSISLLLKFELSPGDSASVSGIFTVVPAPGAISLLGLFGLSLGRRRRRL